MSESLTSKPASHSMTVWRTCSQGERYLFKTAIPLSESPPSSFSCALRKLDRDPKSSTSSGALSSFRFRNWLSGFGLTFFLFLEKEELALNLLFSSLLCSIENFPWIYPGADPLLYFSQHNLVWELLGLDPKCNGLSLFPRYPATLRWCPGPQWLQAWPLALTTISLPQTVFFCLPFLLPRCLVFTFYHNHLSSSSIQPKPRGNLVLPEGYCKDLVAFSLSQSLFLLNSVRSLCSPSPEEKGPNSLYLYSSSS